MSTNKYRVVLTGSNDLANIFGKDYFPRKFFYKKEAQSLLRRVRSFGGTAKIQKWTKINEPNLQGWCWLDN